MINQAEGAIHDIEAKIDEYKDQLPSEEVRASHHLHQDAMMLLVLIVLGRT